MSGGGASSADARFSQVRHQPDEIHIDSASPVRTELESQRSRNGAQCAAAGIAAATVNCQLTTDY
ncbi:MAG: hypothetical protein AMXMBFR42_11150 [Burkholderiales bacterium]